MNLNCIICSDQLTSRSEIYSTSCGHLFHYVCLIQWIERSKTCPQCRHRETETSCHKIYLNIQNQEGIPDNAVTLQCKLDNANFSLSLKENEIKALKEKCSKNKSKALGLREVVVKLESEIRNLESTVRAGKEQILYFKEKSKDIEKYTNEITRLKKELKTMSFMQTVMTGCQDEVDEMLSTTNNPDSLCLLVTTLKKELTETNRRKQKLSQEVLSLRNDIFRANGELDKHREINQRLQSQVNESSEEKSNLKQKILQMSGSRNSEEPDNSLNSSVKRILYESPAPAPRQVDLNEGVVDLTDLASPTIDARVIDLRNSDSPYLSVKPSSSGLGHFLNAKYTTKTTANLSPRLDTNMERLTMFKKFGEQKKGEYTYNGLGGHSKEDTFPQPSLQSRPTKRTKTQSSLKPSKFKKLTPN